MQDAVPTGIDLRHLRYFLAVVEELHFGRAAERIHISQPPLSQAVRRLEDELGVQLLHRNSRSVSTTEAGRVLARDARRILASLEVAVSEARRAGGATATLRIGCTPTLAVARVQRVLSSLAERAPGSQLKVTHLSTSDQLEQLECGELDLGLLCQVDDRQGIVNEPVFPGGGLSAHLPVGHPLAKKAVLSPDDLSGERLVTFPRALNPALHDRLFSDGRKCAYRFSGVTETGTDPRDLVMAITTGLGVALQPPSFTEVGQAEGLIVCRPVDPPLTMPDTVVAWRAKPARHLRAVIQTVRAVARELREAAV
jgi:DNA-binding transcriptional LysR family regulator